MSKRGLATAALAVGWALSVAASPTPSTPPAPTPAASPSAPPTQPPSPSPSPTPSASPTPSPSSGQLNLSPTSGPAQTAITVTGSGFRPSEAVTIYWDNREHSLGGASADASGAFKGEFKAPDDVAGPHVICAQEPNQVCAAFQLTPRASPAPSATPPPSPAVSSPPPVAPTPVDVVPSPDSKPVGMLSLLVQTPFVVFPILVVLALLGLAVWWIRAGSARAPAISSATVRHSASPPPSPAAGPPPPSPAPSEPEPPAPPPPARRPPDEPPDLPTPGD